MLFLENRLPVLLVAAALRQRYGRRRKPLAIRQVCAAPLSLTAEEASEEGMVWWDDGHFS